MEGGNTIGQFGTRGRLVSGVAFLLAALVPCWELATADASSPPWQSSRILRWHPRGRLLLTNYGISDRAGRSNGVDPQFHPGKLFRFFGADWDPSGERLVVSQKEVLPDTGEWSARSLFLTGWRRGSPPPRLLLLAPYQHAYHSPAWQPGGHTIAFLSSPVPTMRDGPTHLCLVNIRKPQLETLQPPPGTRLQVATLPEWDPQGQRLALPVLGTFAGRTWYALAVVEFPSRRWRLHRLPWYPDPAERLQMPELGWDPSGRAVVLTEPRANHTAALQVVETETGVSRPLGGNTGTRPLELSSPTWAPDGKAVACLVASPGWPRQPTRITYCPADGKSARYLTVRPTVLGPWHPLLRWHPGGKGFVCSEEERLQWLPVQ